MDKKKFEFEFVPLTLAVVSVGAIWYALTAILFVVVLITLPDAWFINQAIFYNWSITPYILFLIWIFAMSVYLGKESHETKRNPVNRTSVFRNWNLRFIKFPK